MALTPIDIRQLDSIKAVAVSMLFLMGLILVKMAQHIVDEQIDKLNQMYWIFFSILFIYLILRAVQFIENFIIHEKPYLAKQETD